MQSSIDAEWMAFACGENTMMETKSKTKESISIPVNIPDASPLHLCTKTIIAYISVDDKLDLDELFWDIPIIPYGIPKEGIIKKQIQITSRNTEHVENVQKKYDSITIKKNKHVVIHVTDKDKHCKFKHVEKIDIGISKQDVL